jgi:DNA adenine methylase
MFSGKLWNKIPEFQPIAERLRNVQIEHMDGLACIEQYDSLDTLFYIDPPYIEGDQSCYKARFDRSQHVELINAIKRCKGAVALSGYDNELYNQVDWHDTFEFTVFQSIHGEGTGTKSHLAGAPKTAHGKEKLWLKV